MPPVTIGRLIHCVGSGRQDYHNPPRPCPGWAILPLAARVRAASAAIKPRDTARRPRPPGNRRVAPDAGQIAAIVGRLSAHRKSTRRMQSDMFGQFASVIGAEAVGCSHAEQGADPSKRVPQHHDCDPISAIAWGNILVFSRYRHGILQDNSDCNDKADPDIGETKRRATRLHFDRPARGPISPSTLYQLWQPGSAPRSPGSPSRSVRRVQHTTVNRTVYDSRANPNPLKQA